MASRTKIRHDARIRQNLCCICGKENIAPHSTRMGLKCLRRAAANKMKRRGGPKPRVLVKKKSIVKSSRNWMIRSSPLFQCWS